MPRAARARITTEKPLYAELDTEEDEQEATPIPAHRKRPQKRVSDVFVPGASGSGDAPPRQPFKSVNINDDEAEKRQRRKSTKFAVPLQVEESMYDDGANATPKASKQKLLLASVVDTPAVKVSFDVMSSNFEEWMKMATDNKINAANSWNFALIDYFHDMSLLRNTTDNSINFQRASCTLDGCVKIWTSRVDSVGTETGKLLSNLASEGKGEGGDDDEEGNGSEGESGQRKKRKAHRAEGSTLAKNAAQLQSKKLELDNNVDPLFKKTCADFDEGGAQGLLMNHLSLGMGPDGGMRVVFDASDSIGRDEEDEADLEEPEDAIDISHLRREFLPDLGLLDSKAISHSLASFSFAKDAFSFDEATFINATYRDDSDSDDYGFGEAPMMGDAPFDGGIGVSRDDVHDFFTGDQAVVDDFGGGMDDMGIGMDPGHDAEDGPTPEGEQYAQAGHQAGAGPLEPFDPRRVPNERDLVMAMTEGGGGMFDYFDQNFRKNWAGPEHWKLRKVIRRPDATDAAPKQKREKKEAFKIDFLSPPEKDRKELEKEIFAPVASRGASITLPGYGKKRRGKEKEKRDDQTLPDDMHFSSRQLITLFLKPKFSLRMRGQRLNPQAGEVDENFWAQAAADQAAGRGDNDMDETANGGAIPFNTQFFHDDYDDGPGFDDLYDGDGGGDAPSGTVDDPAEQDLLALTQGETRRVRPEHINYAKRAKRVDVRKLKENIWRGLDIVVEDKPEEDEDTMDMDLDDRPAEKPLTDPTEAKEFTLVISQLRRTYPADKMDEISTSFCFICLLHLANERGLKIEDQVVPDVDEDALDANPDQKVGELWDLKIYRDPDAKPAA